MFIVLISKQLKIIYVSSINESLTIIDMNKHHKFK